MSSRLEELGVVEISYLSGIKASEKSEKLKQIQSYAFIAPTKFMGQDFHRTKPGSVTKEKDFKLSRGLQSPDSSMSLLDEQPLFFKKHGDQSHNKAKSFQAAEFKGQERKIANYDFGKRLITRNRVASQVIKTKLQSNLFKPRFFKRKEADDLRHCSL